MTGYHRIPKDDAWREVTLDQVEANVTDSVWLMCDACMHSVYEPIAEFKRRTGTPGSTPLLTISISLVCGRCGERKSYCKPKPFGL